MDWQKIMNKKDAFKYAILGIAVLFSFFVFINRFIVERKNLEVELVFGYDDVLQLEANTGQAKETIYRSLQKAGITSICLPEDSIYGLSEQGGATMVSGRDMWNMSRMGQIQSKILTSLLSSADIVPGNYYVMIDENATFNRAKSSLVNELSEERVKHVGKNLLEIKGKTENLEEIGFGVDPVLVNSLRWYKFKIVPKLVNSKRLDDVSLGLKIDRLKEVTGVNTVIFNGAEVLGYGNNMKIVVEKMKNNQINFGYIEFANQKGDKALAEALPGQTIGVHSIPLDKLQNLDKARAIDRYFLAVTERGMRILYIHPFLKHELSKDLLTYNEEFISELKNKIEHRGFKITPIKNIDLGGEYKSLSILVVFIISLGVAISLFLFLRLFIPRMPDNYASILVTMFLLLGIVFLKADLFSWWRSFLALLVAVIFPPYVIITQLPKDTKNFQSKEVQLKEVLIIVARLVGITFIGALLITGLLSDAYHMLKIYQFRGVKLAFVLPLAIVAFYYFLYPHKINSIRFIIKRFLQSQVTIGYVIMSLAVALFLGLFLLRSGNFQLPMLFFEADIRNFLGNVMLVRPRTKEFLIGYPIMIFILYNLRKVVTHQHKWLFYTLATVAPISLLNTFCHLHAPLWISILRSLNGLLLGVLVGLMLVFVYKAWEKLYNFIF